MVNNVYDKTIANLRKRINFILLNNEKNSLKYTTRPTHVTHKVFDRNYVAIHEIKPVLTLNKPIYVGFTVIELNKWLMYDFHHKFSNFSKDSKFYDNQNEVVVGKMKVECRGIPINKFVGLKSKLHSILFR